MKNYFKPHEQECKHCGLNKVEQGFLDKLNKIRHEAGFPFVVSSFYRCPEHNKAVSSTGATGPHTTGRAVDIRIHGEQALWVVENARKFGFTGVGINQKGAVKGRFIHLDDLDVVPRPWLWSY